MWQKRKCGVKYGCLTISHSTVSIQPHVNRRGKSGVLPGRLRPRDGTWWHTVYPQLRAQFAPSPAEYWWELCSMGPEGAQKPRGTQCPLGM